jgi:Sulfotransferase family
MLFFNKAKIKIISLHIPKCGGTTFKEILRKIYKDQLQYDYDGEKSITINKKTTVLHGHFALKKYVSIYPKAKYITWIRDPAERIISYYFYWLNAPPHGNIYHDKFLERKMSLIEFADFEPIKREAMKGYLENFNWKYFDMVGIVEHYSRDLRLMSNSFGWKLGEKVEKKNIGCSKVNVSNKDREIIRKIHKDEVEMYEYWNAKNDKR